ncbi:30S ribosomal protein S9 [Rickettsiales endosymbiont of Peranema trichophorum]|uniref:30S ribosomal protein S9 n=1 Tax=Rickettsiales endosymbiont of Peranema trichophorum TaxID=2486577 RepID=UPI001F5DD723|nr:30S ribosomal protein S9 [Rickettsiales endosymbiont of Peranema trichophorum]
MVGEVSSSKLDSRVYATGRRKEAVARVWISRGTGKITVNGVDVVRYFARAALRMAISQPFVITDTVSQYDVSCTVRGSGLSGQAGAIRLGISKALNLSVPEMHQVLKHHKLLTRDMRKVERKIYGHKKSRKSFQFSKR